MDLITESATAALPEKYKKVMIHSDGKSWPVYGVTKVVVYSADAKSVTIITTNSTIVVLSGVVEYSEK